MGDYAVLCYAIVYYAMCYVFTIVYYVFTICACSCDMPCYLLPLSLATPQSSQSLCQQPYTTTNSSLSSRILPFYDINISTLLCCHHDLSLSLSLYTHTHTHIVSTRAGKSPWKAPSTAGFDMMSVRENVVFAFSEASGWTPYMEDR